MRTLKITVDNDKQVARLLEVLNSVDFVKKISTDTTKVASSKTQFVRIKQLLEKFADKKLFKEIKDPIAWQRKLRDEWE
jgi:hypothetical protein